MNMLVHLIMILLESFASGLLMQKKITSEHWRRLALLSYNLVIVSKQDMYSFRVTEAVLLYVLLVT